MSFPRFIPECFGFIASDIWYEIGSVYDILTSYITRITIWLSLNSNQRLLVERDVQFVLRFGYFQNPP